MEGEPFVVSIGGEEFVSIGGEERMVAHDGPRHSAIYEIDGPHVLDQRFRSSKSYQAALSSL